MLLNWASLTLFLLSKINIESYKMEIGDSEKEKKPLLKYCAELKYIKYLAPNNKTFNFYLLYSGQMRTLDYLC